jgi:hypothetical protein
VPILTYSAVTGGTFNQNTVRFVRSRSNQSNILVELVPGKDGLEPRALLSDFGLARVSEHSPDAALPNSPEKTLSNISGERMHSDTAEIRRQQRCVINTARLSVL